LGIGSLAGPPDRYQVLREPRLAPRCSPRWRASGSPPSQP